MRNHRGLRAFAEGGGLLLRTTGPLPRSCWAQGCRWHCAPLLSSPCPHGLPTRLSPVFTCLSARPGGHARGLHAGHSFREKPSGEPRCRHASQEHPACAVATWAACMEWHIRGWGREGRKAEAMNRRVRCCACVSEGGDPQPAYRFFLRHSHGGVGLRVFHSPMLVCRALLAAKYQARQG